MGIAVNCLPLYYSPFVRNVKFLFLRKRAKRTSAKSTQEGCGSPAPLLFKSNGLTFHPAASSWGLLNSVFNMPYRVPSCAKTFDFLNFFVSSCIIIFRLVIGNCGKICGNLKDGIFSIRNDHLNVFLMIYHCLQFVNSYYLSPLTHTVFEKAPNGTYPLGALSIRPNDVEQCFSLHNFVCRLVCIRTIRDIAPAWRKHLIIQDNIL